MFPADFRLELTLGGGLTDPGNHTSDFRSLPLLYIFYVSWRHPASLGKGTAPALALCI